MATLNYFGDVRAITNIESETVDAADVSAALAHIRARYGAGALKAAKRSFVIVNGFNILLLQKYRTPLKSGDDVSFLPVCGGG